MWVRSEINKQVTVTNDTTANLVIKFTFFCVKAVKFYGSMFHWTVTKWWGDILQEMMCCVRERDKADSCVGIPCIITHVKLYN